ncbi:SGNH/GDSL hydrolase family protein [Nocardioides sp. CPCC 205120]|uniref:SGNH/GDSL hydrolase family protein n=1 Tax=Nocardioides sp. CPCC 205120 TaxID=3406462 RepID=UPI003B513AEE
MTVQGATSRVRSYLRFAAVGDSTTVGVGDPVPGNPGGLGAGATGRDGTWRGWAVLLARALETSYDVSFCNLAVSGATARDVVERQLDDAVDHRPDLVSLVVGLNDTMRSSWDPDALRADLLGAAGRLTADGALLLTVRFHDHGEVLGLPQLLRRPMLRRIEVVNAVYDEVHARYGGVRVDLATCADVRRRDCWSVDRLHPSERGHRALARAFAEELAAAGMSVVPPAAEPDGTYVPSWRTDLAWMVTEGAPWVGRRARDLGPWAARAAWAEARTLRPVVRRRSVAGGHHDGVAVGDGDGVLAVGPA